jgi:hypothetical protein
MLWARKTGRATSANRTSSNFFMVSRCFYKNSISGIIKQKTATADETVTVAAGRKT